MKYVIAAGGEFLTVEGLWCMPVTKEPPLPPEVRRFDTMQHALDVLSALDGLEFTPGVVLADDQNLFALPSQPTEVPTSPGKKLHILPTPAKDPSASQSVENVLLRALDASREGRLPFVMVTGRDMKTGAVMVLLSQPLDECQALGCLEMVKSAILDRIQREKVPT